MGKLALFGAMAGAGGGLQTAAKMKHEKELTDMDAERQEGLARLQDKLKGEREGAAAETARAQELADVKSQREFQTTTREAEERFKTREREEEQTYGTAEREEEEKHKTGIQSQKDIAAMERTMVSSGESESLIKRFQFNTETVESLKGGRITSEVVTTVMDKQAGVPFRLFEDKFVPEGTDPASIQKAAREDIEFLYSNPDDEVAGAFLRDYNYLPRDFMRTIQGVQRTKTSSRRRPVGPRDDTP